MRTIPEVVEELKGILNNAENTHEFDGSMLTEIDELGNEILAIDGYKSKVQTNAERIQTMSIEELAEFLKGIDNGHEIGVGDYFYTEKYKVMMRSEKVLEWLQSEVEGA